jgi:hypothetical protein
MRSSPRWTLWLLTAAALILAWPAAAAPESVWVAWLDGHTVDEAIATGAVVLDRFPDAAIVADATSARRLEAAGYRVEAPIALPTGATVTLLRMRVSKIEALDPSRLASLGVTILWRGKENALLSSAGPLPEDAQLLAGRRAALRATPLRRAITPVEGSDKSPSPNITLATDFAPVVQEMVDQVSGADYMQWIRNLSGAPILVGGNPVSFTTRSTPTVGCDRAEQYVFEQLQALGYADVQYDPYTFSSTSARNVVATLPGTVHPERIVVLGGHLDSTSPQASTNAPGANDNASGIAGLLIAAQILKQYSFENTIKIVAFTGEEQGLFGSTHFANAASGAGQQITDAVIMDMIGWKNVLNQIDIEGETAWLPLMTVMADAVTRYTSIAAVMRFNSFGSDHVPFQDVGYPAFLAIETEYDDYPCYHQTCDTTGWNQPTFGAETIKAVVATVANQAVVRQFSISHTPLAGTENTTGPYDVVATIHQIAALDPDSLVLHWWANSGPENLVPLVATGNPGEYHAGIPGQSAGTLVHYWIQAGDVEARRAVHPAGAPGVSHQFLVASRTTLFSEGFESGAAGWTHGGIVDDWQIAAPAGLADDPAAAYAGSKVAGTDLTGLGANPGKYEGNANSWLESPPIDCSGATGVRLSFQRKLMVERSYGGAWDYARVQVNGTTVWESPSGPSNLIDLAWNLQEFDISSLADGQAAVRIRYTLKSDGSVSFGGWNIDEVALTGLTLTPVAVDPRGIESGAVRLAVAPNPGPASVLRFDLPVRADVSLAIYDMRGRLVRSLWRGPREAGHHELRWDGRGTDGAPSAAGMYFCRLTSGDVVRSCKLALVH